jgi:hypothetical protein
VRKYKLTHERFNEATGEWYSIDSVIDHLFYLLSLCYYISTTVNIIGYGEMTPQSSMEKLLVIFLMFTGQFMAVYFLGQFIEIIISAGQNQLSNTVTGTIQEIEL